MFPNLAFFHEFYIFFIDLILIDSHLFPISQFQTMIYMPTWRYGIQNFPGKQGCILQSYNHSFNVTLTEWYLPYKFGLVGAIILLAFSLGLYAVLLYRSLIAPGRKTATALYLVGADRKVKIICNSRAGVRGGNVAYICCVFQLVIFSNFNNSLFPIRRLLVLQCIMAVNAFTFRGSDFLG